MKIALISHMFDREIGGGAVAAVAHLASGLRQLSHDVTIITTHARLRGASTLPDGTRLVHLPPLNLYWVGDKDHHHLASKMLWQSIDTWNLRMHAALRKLLIKESPDLVHIHKLRGLSAAVWSAADLTNVPLVQTCHDYEAMSPEGTLTGRLGQMALKGTWLRPYQALRAALSASVDLVTAPSRYTLDTLTGRAFFPRAERVVIPNTHGLTRERVDSIRMESQVRTVGQDEPIRFLYLGRLEAVKGVDVLLNAFLKVAERTPLAELHIVGWGTEEEQLRARFEHHPRILFHGARYGDEKTALIQSADIGVVPSVWPEVFGIVIPEMQLFGKPIIASDIGGIPELIEKGRTGLLVPPGDEEALARAMMRFVNRRELGGEMSAFAYEAARNFTVEAVTNAYVDAYHQLQRRTQTAVTGHRGYNAG